MFSSSRHFCRIILPPFHQKITHFHTVHLPIKNGLNSPNLLSNSPYTVLRPSTTLLLRQTTVYRSLHTDSPDESPPSNPGPSDSMDFIKYPDLSPDDQKRFDLFQFEVEVARQSGADVPSHLSENDWRRALRLSSRMQRTKFYRFLFLSEMTEINRKKKKLEASKIRVARSQQEKEEFREDPTVMKYGLNYNTFFPFIRDPTMLKSENVRMAQARLFSNPLIYDVDYDDWMSERERSNVGKQIQHSYATNKASRDPFWMQICNARMGGMTMESMHRLIPNLYEPSCMIEVSEKSYLDLFPKSKLVYLTYNAQDTLHEFNPEDIYIIGGLVDKTFPKPLSMAKAKREGLRMAKLPLDHYLKWTVGGKNLTINQMTGILCEMKLHGDWERAFKEHIPKRKYLQPEDFDPDSPALYHKELQRLPFRERMDRQVARRDGGRPRSVLESLLNE